MAVRDWQDPLQEKILIDGAWRQAKYSETISVDKPAKGDHLGTVPKGGTTDARAAIEAAHAAFCFVFPDDGARATLLRDLSTAFLDNQELLAQLLAREQGKPLAEARTEVAGSAAYLYGLRKRRVAPTATSSPRHGPTGA